MHHALRSFGVSLLVTALVPPATGCEAEGGDASGGGDSSTNGTASSTGGSPTGASTATASSSTGGSDGGGGQGGGAPAGDDNPDGLPEASSPIYANDYEVEDMADVVHDPGIAIGEWDAAHGYQSAGWRFQPDPISGAAVDNEDSAGWGGGGIFPVDAYHLVSVSYLYRVSSTLVDEIALGGPFWAHDQKSIDFKYHDPGAPYGEGRRNGIHFGEDGGQVRFAHVDGGAGTRLYFGPDWATLADEWVWLCHVIDMRGASPSERYIATYIKRDGDAGVTRLAIRHEDSDPPLQPYDGRGVWGFFSPIHGYWDDMIGRDGLSGALDQMHMAVDRVRVMPGWPDAANGPPF
jgi:hypothetical protein